jgi:type IV pilus assembly protein PilA
VTQPQAPYPPPQSAPPAKKKMSCGIMALIAAGAAVPLMGVFAALAINGVRRYLAASKSSEAKATVAAISRAAEAAYQLRAVDVGAGSSAMCGSATAVPSVVPTGNKYASAASDWDSGDEANGWRCLRFAISIPQYYQYHYNKDGAFLGPVPTGASNSFEVAGVGDLDGDGITSLFARHGMLSPTGELRLSTQIYTDNEFE